MNPLTWWSGDILSAQSLMIFIQLTAPGSLLIPTPPMHPLCCSRAEFICWGSFWCYLIDKKKCIESSRHLASVSERSWTLAHSQHVWLEKDRKRIIKRSLKREITVKDDESTHTHPERASSGDEASVAPINQERSSALARSSSTPRGGLFSQLLEFFGYLGLS